MLIDTITEDLKNAMKAKDEIKTGTLRMLKAALKNKMIEKITDVLNDEEALDVVQKQAKLRKESIEEFKKANRTDLIEKETKELAILEKYLPKQMSEEELTNLIKDAIKTVGAQSKVDMGKIMKELMPKVRGKADGKEVNRIASTLLP